jgi:hypothetical protein
MENTDAFTSAEELISKRNLLREQDWDKRANRFTDKEVKQKIINQYDLLRDNWDYVMAYTYFDLLQKQTREINRVFNENSPFISGVQALTNVTIDSAIKSWYDDVFAIYESMGLDFAYNQAFLLLPDELKSDDNTMFTQAEQDDITRARRRKPREEIIKDGFYPQRKRGQAIPINRTGYNRKAKAFVEGRLREVLPEMSNTMKKNLNTALRKGYDDVIRKGLTGADAERYMRKAIKDSIGKKNLGRAMNIARTETTALSNWAQTESASQTGLNLKKEWITTRDGKVRDAHYVMDNKSVPQKEYFSVQGYEMFFPADSSKGAPAGLVCNCRCSLIYHEVKI